MKRIVRITVLAILIALVLTILAIAAPVQAATQPQVQLISGTVYGNNDGATVLLDHAYITARVSAWDPLYNRTNPNANILARTYSYSNGRYVLYIARKCYVGTWVEITATHAGYLPITQYGPMYWTYQTNNFANGYYGDCRLPVDQGGFPPLPIGW